MPHSDNLFENFYIVIRINSDRDNISHPYIASVVDKHPSENPTPLGTAKLDPLPCKELHQLLFQKIQLHSPCQSAITELGKFWRDWLLREGIAEPFFDKIEKIAQTERTHLRIWLCIDKDLWELEWIPNPGDSTGLLWECLRIREEWEKKGNRSGERIRSPFITLNPCLSIIRYRLGSPISSSIAVAEPLRILLVYANPPVGHGYIEYLEAQKDAIIRSLELIRNEGLVQVQELDGPESHDVEKALEKYNPHVFIFLGHGYGAGHGGIWVRKEENKNLEGLSLAKAAKEGGSLRLVFLPNCQTLPIAPLLLKYGIPAVVSMQRNIHDMNSLARFTRVFFKALAEFKPLEECIQSVREELADHPINPTRPDFIIPTIYFASQDGHLFAPKKDLIRGRYLRHVVDMFKYMPTFEENRNLPIENFYITLKLGQEVGKTSQPLQGGKEFSGLTKDQEIFETTIAWRESHEYVYPRHLEPVKVEDAITRSCLIVVKGDPGSGKTTLIQYLAYNLAQNLLEKDQGKLKLKPLIPIVVKLNEWSEHDPNFLCYLRDLWSANIGIPSSTDRDFSRDDFINLVEGWIQSGECILLLDGLDEVIRDREPFINSLIQFANGLARNCKILVTTRIVGYDNQLLGFKHYEILPFEQRQTQEFIKGYFADGQNDKADALIRAIQNTFQMRPLAANPLLLKIICWVFGDPKWNLTLPAKRIELYDWAVDKLFGRRQTAISQGDKRPVLEGIALHYFPKQVFEEDDLLVVIRDILDKRKLNLSDAGSILDDIVKNSGLLVQLSRGKYIFLHLTFQEYFTACAIAKSDDWLDIVKKNMKYAKWHEVIRLLAARFSAEARNEEQGYPSY